MSSVAYRYNYEDVCAYEDLVYAMEFELGVVHVYRNRNNSLIKLHDIRYPCKCNAGLFSHSIIVTNENIVQCCASRKLVSIQNVYGELLRIIRISDMSGRQPILRQVDIEGNFLIADRWTKHLIIANVNQSSSQWDVVDLTDLPGRFGCVGAVWFRHRLYVVSSGGLLTSTHVD